jgi:hypothetical protein
MLQGMLEVRRESVRSVFIKYGKFMSSFTVVSDEAVFK